MPDEAELKGLQIRAELSKLGEPSRSYADHLAKMVEDPSATAFGDAGRIMLSSRFAQIMGAKPSSSPYAGRAPGQPLSEEQIAARREKL